MAFYSLAGYFLTEYGTLNTKRQLCIEVQDDIQVNPVAAMVRERSRGHHDPGDGPYENRMAFGGETIVEVKGKDKEYVLQGSSFLIRKRDENFRRTARFYEDWSKCTYAQLIVSERRDRTWGYDLTVKAYQYNPKDEYVWYKSYTAGDYGFTEREAETIGLQLFNQYKGIGYALCPGSYNFERGDPVIGAKVERGPKLSQQSITPLDTLDADYVNRRIETGLASAFLDACDKLPSTAGINNIANLADVISSFKSMSKGLTKLGSAADAWLAYRYSYSTTKSDILALNEFASRLAALPSCIHSNGFFRDGDWVYRVSINVSSPYLASLVSLGEKWGVALDAVNAWDLIPYSFIVDWFIPVSDLLERWQSQSFAMQIQQTSWCSVRHEYVNEFGFKEIDYSRFLYEPQARFASVSHIAYGSRASTIVKRALDVLALFA